MSRRARKGDPHTSHEAGDSMPPEVLGKQYTEILRVLKEHGPGTMHDIKQYTHLRLDQIHKRLPEMEDINLVWRPGETAPGPSNRKCKIWHQYTDSDRPDSGKPELAPDPAPRQPPLIPFRDGSESNGVVP